MAKIPEYYNAGTKNNLTTEELLEILLDMYRELSIQINKKPDLYIRDTDGQADDIKLSNGDININSSTQKVEMLVDRTATTVTWKEI